MAFCRALALLPILLVAGAAGQALAVQPDAPAAAERLARQPYVGALAAVANYHGCGVRAIAARAAELNAALQAGEAAARAKGLGPTLERQREHYHAMLAVSTMVVCVQGPAPALASARRALADFRRWVAAQPAGRPR